MFSNTLKFKTTSKLNEFDIVYTIISISEYKRGITNPVIYSSNTPEWVKLDSY